MSEIGDDVIDAAAKALVREQTQGLCDENYPNPCDGCDCDFGTGRSMMIGYAQEHTRIVLAAAAPLIERQLREKIERDIIALAPYNCELLYNGREDPQTAAWVEGIKDAARVARRADTGREQ